MSLDRRPSPERLAEDRPLATTRRRFTIAAAASAASATAFSILKPALAKAADNRVQICARDLPSSPPTALDATAWFDFEQTRGGAPQGDPVMIFRNLSLSDPYKDETYFTDNGAIYTGAWIIVSQKRMKPYGGNPANGAYIQGISSVPDGSEGSMVAISPDVNGPALACEANTANQASYKNQSAFAAYDIASISGGYAPYSKGYGRKKFVIRGDGGLWWGPDLQKDPWANSDVRLERLAPGALRLSAPQSTITGLMMVDSLDSASRLQLTQSGATRAQLSASAAGNLQLDVGAATPLKMYKDWGGVAFGGLDVNPASAATATVPAQSASVGAVGLRMAAGTMQSDMLRTTSASGPVMSGVDRQGAFFDYVKSNAAGPPTSGTWNTGSCLVNTADGWVYCCVSGGTPGTWKRARLTR